MKIKENILENKENRREFTNLLEYEQKLQCREELTGDAKYKCCRQIHEHLI